MSNELISEINRQCSIYWRYASIYPIFFFLILTIPAPSFVLNSKVFFNQLIYILFRIVNFVFVHFFSLNPLFRISRFTLRQKLLILFGGQLLVDWLIFVRFNNDRWQHGFLFESQKVSNSLTSEPSSCSIPHDSFFTWSDCW